MELRRFGISFPEAIFLAPLFWKSLLFGICNPEFIYLNQR